MFHYDYKTENTCSQLISLDLDGDVVHNVRFMGGCNGNLKAIPLLIEGWTVEQIARTIRRSLRTQADLLCGPAGTCSPGGI